MYCEDLGESFHKSIFFLQKSAWIQSITSYAQIQIGYAYYLFNVTRITRLTKLRVWRAKVPENAQKNVPDAEEEASFPAASAKPKPEAFAIHTPRDMSAENATESAERCV